MDLIGEIIENEVGAPQPPTHVELNTSKFKRRQSRFKSQGLKNVNNQAVHSVGQTRDETKVIAKNETEVEEEREESEAMKIHKENIQKLSSMSMEEIDAERQELMSNLDPKLISSLLKRAEKRELQGNESHGGHDHHEHAEGYEGWYGGMKTSDGLKDLSVLDEQDINRALGISEMSLEDRKTKKKVKFDDVATVIYDGEPEIMVEESGWEDVEDINDLIPEHMDEVTDEATDEEMADEGYQINSQDEPQSSVHFPKPNTKSVEFGKDLDLNDPDFYDKLHEKYYPDLPKETSKLAWMTQPLPQQRTTTYESISDMRFDFQGDLVQLSTTVPDDQQVPTYLGLHHHSDNPHLPGYTLQELAHLSRSTMAGQRCLSIQMLGRILHKLGLHKYSILPIEEGTEEFNDNFKQVMTQFETMMWELIEKLRIIESITEASSEKTNNLSVRNYAIEALWLWKQGGGKPQNDEVEELTQQIM